MLSNFILIFVLLFLIFFLTFYIVSKILNNKKYTSEKNDDSFRNENTHSTRWPFNRKLDFSMEKPPKTDTIRCCPYCDSKVPKGAWKCWHCKNRLPVRKSDIIAYVVLGFVFFLVFFILLISRYAGGSQSSSSLSAAIVVYDKQNISISVSNIDYSQDAAKIRFFIENGSNDNISFFCSTFVINDVMIDGLIWIDVAASSKASDTLYLDNSALKNIGIDRICTFETYDAHISFDQPEKVTQLVPINLSTTDQSSSKIDVSGNIIYSENGVTVISRFLPGQYTDTIPLLVINNSGQDFNIWTSHVTVNGHTIPEWHYESIVRKNAIRYFNIQLTDNGLSEADIKSIKSASFVLDFLIPKSTESLFSTGPLYVH